MEKETIHTTSSRQTFTSALVGVVTLNATGNIMLKFDPLGMHSAYYSCRESAIAASADQDVCVPPGKVADAASFGVEMGLSILAAVFAARVAANLMGDRRTVITTREKAPVITAETVSAPATASTEPAPQI